MDKTMLNIKLLYKKMGKAEKKIADWLFENPNEILPLSIVDLADRCGCSEATIVRFAKRLGFSGYQELKISLAQESNSASFNTNITEDDTLAEIYDKVCNDIYCSLERTKTVLNTQTFEQACEKISKANRIVIFGLGNSASVAHDASHKLLRVGCNASSYSDNHMQVIVSSHLKPGDVVIGISHSGSSKDIVDAFKIAKESGAITIAITNNGKSPIQKFSDYVLFTASDETKYNILALNSRIAQLAIINAIYFYLIYHKSEDVMESIKETERSLLNKKF